MPVRFFDAFRHKQTDTPPSAVPETRSAPHYADGRRYREDIPYYLPQDAQENQRLDYQDYIFQKILGGLCFAPVEPLLQQGCHVLEVGAGSNRWAYDITRKYPRSQVMAFDIEDRRSSVVPDPANFRFQQGNLLQGLPFAAQQFMYVHQRLLVLAIPTTHWLPIVGELKRVTKPSGYIELVEAGTTFHHAGPALQQMATWWQAISAAKGIDMQAIASIGSFLQQVGCQHIQTKTETVPVGTWGGRLGKLVAQDMLAIWTTMSPLVYAQLGVPQQHFQYIMEQIADEWEDTSFHASYDVYFAAGQAE